MDTRTKARRHSTRRAATAAMLALPFLLVGCASLGPGTVARDRSDYAASISESWKRQALLNIVKLRYLDPPIFVDVGQIVAGYSLETTVTATGTFPEIDAGGGKTASVGAGGRYTDRPTITYVPLTGNRFVRSLMTPLPPESVFFTLQAGWPADAVLFATVASLNGLKNQETTIAGISPPEPDFLRALALMRRLQQSGTVGMRVEGDPSRPRPQEQSTLLMFRTTDVSPETLADSRELRRLLKLDPHADRFRLAFGGTASSDKEVAVVTRSILHLMQTMASQVDVPEEDVVQGRVGPGWPPASADAAAAPRLIRVSSAGAEPDDAFVSVRYRGRWFWIDDRDLKTKRTFAFLMLLFTLADTGERETLPLITIPAQ